MLGCAYEPDYDSCEFGYPIRDYPHGQKVLPLCHKGTAFMRWHGRRKDWGSRVETVG